MTRTLTHLVVTDNFAGVERYVTTVAAETARRGWRVRVVGGRREEMSALLPSTIEWSPVSGVLAAVSRLTRDPADVVHAHMTQAEVAACLTPRRHAVVATRHFAATRGRNAAVTAATNLAARRIDAEIAISEAVRRASGAPDMRVLLNAVPAVARARRPERTVVVAQRWDVEKRTIDAIDAFDRSGLAADGWRLVIHGTGREEPALRRRAATSSAPGAIEVAGFAGDMPDVLARAGVLLAPAEHEPFGLTVAEAMAAGTPVVATASGGHLETVGQVEPAALFPPGDVGACARVLRDVALSSEAHRAAVGVRMRRWAVQHLSVEAHVDALCQVYESVARR